MSPADVAGSWYGLNPNVGQAAPARPLPHRTPTDISKIKRHDRLGSLLHEYQQAA